MTIQLEYIFLIAIGGAVGGIGRFWVSGLVAHHFGGRFPWGTLAVNISGAALIGVLAALISASQSLTGFQQALWLAFAVGTLGSYTTVSTFSFETIALFRSGEPGRAVANMVASVGLCITGASSGYFGAARLIGGA